MQYQTTIAKDVTYTGNGLHSGRKVTITLKPAPVDTGIVFIRVDLDGLPRIGYFRKCHIDYKSDDDCGE